MGNNDQDLVLRLQFAADTAAAAAAAKTVDELKGKATGADKSVDSAGKSLASAGQVAGRAAEQIGTVAGAMGSAGGAAGQAAAGVRLLSGAIQTMTTAGGGLPGLLSAVSLLAASSLVNWLVRCSKETKDLNEQARTTEGALTKMSKVTFDAITAQTEKLRSAAAGAADQYERVLSARNRMSSAQEQADLAQIELRKLQRLERADPKDEFGRRKIEAEAAAQSAAVSTNAEAERRSNEILIAERKLEELRQQAALAEAEAARKASVVDSQRSRYDQMGQTKAFYEANPEGRTDEQRQALDIAMGELAASINANTKAVEEARAKAEEARSQIGPAEMDVLTSRTTRATSDITGSANAASARSSMADIRADAAARAKELADKRAADDKRQADLLKARNDEYKDVGTAKRTGASSEALAKELAEFKAASKAESDFRAEIVKQRKLDKAEIERLTEALKNFPAQNN